MNEEDIVRCQQAIELANSDQKQPAYGQFCALYNRNTDDTTILSWIAYTTPYHDEAQRAIATIARLEPAHPRLQFLRRYVGRRQQRAIVAPDIIGPVLTCPYCHHTGPVRVTHKIAVGGWIWFASFFLLFLTCMVALVPIAQAASVGDAGVVFLVIGIIGLFAIRKRAYICGACSAALGDIAH